MATRFDASEVREVLRMIESESLDIRAVTLGVSLRDTAAETLERTSARMYEKLMRMAERLVPTTAAVQADFAVPITTTRLSVTPIALVTEPTRAPRVVDAARAMDRAAGELGVDYIGGFSALVEKGMTPGDRALIDSIAEALGIDDAGLLVRQRRQHAGRHQRRRRAGDGAGREGDRRGDGRRRAASAARGW